MLRSSEKTDKVERYTEIDKTKIKLGEIALAAVLHKSGDRMEASRRLLS